jgi:hypothetical protein
LRFGRIVDGFLRSKDRFYAVFGADRPYLSHWAKCRFSNKKIDRLLIFGDVYRAGPFVSVGTCWAISV